MCCLLNCAAPCDHLVSLNTSADPTHIINFEEIGEQLGNTETCKYNAILCPTLILNKDE
jgi:hypothetical protein